MLIPGMGLPVIWEQTNVLIIACRGFEFAPLVSTILVVFRLSQLARDIHKFPFDRWSVQTIMRVGFVLICIPAYFMMMYRQMHLWISFGDFCPHTTRYYFLPLYSLAVAFFLHTYPLERFVPEMFGVPTTLPCTAPWKRELMRMRAIQEMNDNALVNGADGDKDRPDGDKGNSGANNNNNAIPQDNGTGDYIRGSNHTFNVNRYYGVRKVPSNLKHNRMSRRGYRVCSSRFDYYDLPIPAY